MNNKLKELIQYCRECIAGKINCCTKHKHACIRFLKDYEATKKPGSKFIYKWDRVAHVIKWAALFKHTKGILTGEPIDLDISQVFIVANLYGFYYSATGYRRFQKFYYQVGRKNAKSQLLAVILSYELMVFTGGLAEIYCAATKREQAQIVYSEMKAILQGCKLLVGKWKESYHRLKHLKTGSFCRALSQEDRKLGDGLNPQAACIDEYHAHPTTEVYDILDSAMGARPEPLLGIITTAGFDLNNPCYTTEYKMISRVLDPHDETDLESVFCDIHELEINTTSEDIVLDDGKKVAPGDLLDDPFNEKNWIKANPIVCSYPEGVDNLRKRAKEAKAAPDKLRNFYTKHMNIWVNQRDAGYMPLLRWSACRGDLPDLNGAPCFVGLDLSAKNDLTSAGLVFPLNGVYAVIGHSFMPENTFSNKMKTDLVPYDLWEKDGWITLTKGAVVDYNLVVDWVKKTILKLNANIQEFCVDPWGSIQIANDLIRDGYEVVNIVQGIKTLSEPTKDFRNQVYEKNLVHDGNPVIAWAIGNAVVDIVDRNMNILLNKSKSTERIDPIAALINGYVRAMIADTLGGVYGSRGMRQLG
jgi:phage terminase large subunit-like protein